MQPVFGAYRLVLATLVAYSHIGEFHHLCGSYAVFAFFVLSGYLMTMALEQVYLPRRLVRAYALNRALRIYPLYWLALAAAAWVATGPLTLWGEIMWPRSFMEWLYNVAIFGPLPAPANEWRLLSIAWSLQTELLFYLMLPLVLAREWLYRVWLVASAVCLGAYVLGFVEFFDRYFTLWGAWPAFAAGSALWHYRARLRALPHLVGIGCIVAALGVMLFYKALLPQPMGAGFYVPLLLNVAVAHYLSRVRVRWQRLDAWLGELAYPVFLLHLPVGELARRALPAELASYSLPFFACAMPVVYEAAVLLWWAADRPLQRIRARVRAGQGAGAGCGRPR